MVPWIVLAILFATAVEIYDCDFCAVVLPAAGGGSRLLSGTPSRDPDDCCSRPGACTCCSPVLMGASAPAIRVDGAATGVVSTPSSYLPSPERPRIDHPPKV
jgi:hypothetical protein